MVKEVIIGGKHVGYANKAEVSPDITDAEETKTFDGSIIDTPESIAWKIDIDKIRYDKTSKSYAEMETLLLSMFKTPKTITIREDSKGADGKDITVETNVYDCLLSDKKYSIDAESRTAENLSFKGSPMEEKVNGKVVGKI